ncbi:MAG TPA: DsbA family protein [Anaerolineae bacterium]|nr:DsbA family protein [Anaerolineae bacterium]
MFTRPRLGLLFSLLALFMLLAACTFLDLFRPAPGRSLLMTPTPSSLTPVQVHANTLGDVTAPITMEEYVDFQCPACGDFARGTLQDIKEKYVKSGQVKMVLHHYPFIGEESTRAAEASECANDQGKFWEYADVLFQNQAGENQGAFADAKLEGFAEELKLDMDEFKACLADRRHLPTIQASVQEGTERGINSVPTLFINGQMVRGGISLKQFEQYLTPYLK